MVIEVKALSLGMAKKMAASAEKKALEKQVKIVIAIMDAHGIKYYHL